MEPCFKKLKQVFFGNVAAPTTKTDKNFREKLKCLTDLGTLIPRKKQIEYKVLLDELSKNA